MDFDLSVILKQIWNMYKKLSAMQKLALPLLFVLGVVSIVFISKWASRPEYEVLFSNLRENSAASVIQQLKDKKISYTLQDNGHTVLVAPPSIINELRLDLASNGIPSSGSIGFEVFKENSFGRTGFVEKIMGVQALQGELERTIASISAVQSVRVHITKPERSVFVTKDIAPTASVFLDLKAGTSLEKKQIKGITNLVANAVEGLTPENITIVDEQGSQLSYQAEAELDGLDISRFDYQKKLEQTYEKRIESMLSGILGDGKAIARVTAELDFNKVEKEEEIYDPSSKVARSERLLSDKLAGTEEVGGVSGVMSNLQNQRGLLKAPDGQNGLGRKESLVNYEISRSVSRTTAQLGRLSRLSVAVLVDGNYTTTVGAAEAEYKPLSTEMIKQIENLVKQSVGYDSARGDMVTVENIRFIEPTVSTPLATTTPTGINFDWQNKAFLMETGQVVVPFLIAVFFFIFMVRPLVKTLLAKPTEADVDLSRLLPTGIKELEAELEAERKKLSTSIGSDDIGTIDIEELEGLIASNAKMTKENPQQAALLIRHWLNEGIR
ncbi:MAG: flagellar M-ring protein FliF [Deltaproteobacteria bacterium]|jgi:flagellar M-ring protein FliF|nr:flagellar M-ring protein FliF [Deltaproteobacteria bacterium]